MGQIEDLLERPRRYSNVDGMDECGAGFYCLGCALILWLMVRTPARSFWHEITLLIFAGLVCAIRYGTKAIKRHVTYPRTGFVEYRSTGLRTVKIVSAISSALVTVGVALVMRRHWEIATPVSLVGIVLAGVYLYRMAGAVRWKWVVGGAIAAGAVAIALLPANVIEGLAVGTAGDHPFGARMEGAVLLSLLVYGTILLVSGGISFGLYLRRTQPPAGESR